MVVMVSFEEKTVESRLRLLIRFAGFRPQAINTDIHLNRAFGFGVNADVHHVVFNVVFSAKRNIGNIGE